VLPLWRFASGRSFYRSAIVSEGSGCRRKHVEQFPLVHFTLNITVFNATLSTLGFTLVLHVSATLGHHQALMLLLLQLFHFNFAFIPFIVLPFICLMLCLTLVVYPCGHLF
jgi:hypothetical protein